MNLKILWCRTWTWQSSCLRIKPQSQCDGIIHDCVIQCLHYKKMTRPLLGNQDITHHIKQRRKLQTLFSPGGQVERRGGHLMWAQTFIYYLLLWSKDKGNEDDYPVTRKNRWTRQSWLNCSLTATWALHNTLPPNFHFFMYFWSTAILQEYVQSC